MKKDYEKKPTQELPPRGKQPDNRNDAREEKRAQVYGIKPDDLLEQPIVVGPGKYVRLSGLDRKEKDKGLVRLEPKDIDDVKRWIGVTDELGARRSCCGVLPAAIPGVSSAAELRKLDLESQRAVRALAQEYVHGDSRTLTSYKSVLDHLVDRAVITGVFLRQDIDIHSGSVLEIGRDIKVLFARHIRIWRGGQLKITGPTKIDCVSITGNLQTLSTVAVEQLPAFAVFLSMEVQNG
jgi:hypothetical protein